MCVTLSLWWYMTLTYWICVYNNQILTCKCDICLPYCQLVTLNLSLNMDNRLHNILIRIRNNLLMPDGKLQHYRCSHSKSRICRKIVSLLLRLLLLLIIIIIIMIMIIIMKTIYAAYLGVYLYTAEKESSSLLLRFLILICRFFVAMIVIIST